MEIKKSRLRNTWSPALHLGMRVLWSESRGQVQVRWQRSALVTPSKQLFRKLTASHIQAVQFRQSGLQVLPTSLIDLMSQWVIPLVERFNGYSIPMAGLGKVGNIESGQFKFRYNGENSFYVWVRPLIKLKPDPLLNLSPDRLVKLDALEWLDSFL